MRRSCPALFTAVDPVVAVHRSRGEADASLHALRCAGFGRDMLTVIGERRADGDTGHIAHEFGAGPSRWADSGMLWGLLWAAAAAAATRSAPMGSSAFGALLMLGAVALVIHVAIMARLLGPEDDQADAGPLKTSRLVEDAGASPDWRFVVVVRGSRSDIAVARTILAHREPVLRGQLQPAA